MSSPPEILSDQKIFHRWQPCPFKYFLVCHFVHPGYPHDRTQMSHHEGMQLFHLSSVHCPGLGYIYGRVDSTTARYTLPLTRMGIHIYIYIYIYIYTPHTHTQTLFYVVLVGISRKQCWHSNTDVTMLYINIST